MLEELENHLRTIIWMFYAYGVRNNEEERIMELCAAMDMTARNAFFEKRSSHQVIL